MPEERDPGDGDRRLLEVLRQIGRASPGRVGFGVPRQATAQRRALALLAALPNADGSLIAAAQESGADGAFVALERAQEVDARKTKDGAVWPVCGIAPNGHLTTPAELDAARRIGIDSVAVRPRGALAACFSPRRRGLLALLDQHIPPDGLRAAAALPADAFILDDGDQQGRLSGDDLLWITLAAGLARGPVVVMSARVDAEDLEALAGLGIAGLAMPFPDGASPETVHSALTAIKAAIDTLDPQLRRQGRDGPGGPVLIPFHGSTDEE